MGKGKGHQSGNFASKRLQVANRREWNERVWEASSSSRRPKKASQSTSQNRSAISPMDRLRWSSVGHLGPTLKSILRERQAQDQYELMQRRRRNGYLPPVPVTNTSTVTASQKRYPPGWIILHKQPLLETIRKRTIPSSTTSACSTSSVPSLQSCCIDVLGRHIREYLDALGREELHGILSLLPSEHIMELSIAISKVGGGFNNDLAYAVGKHPQVQALCFRASPDPEDTLDERGWAELQSLDSIHRRTADDPCVVDCWEDILEEDGQTGSRGLDWDMALTEQLQGSAMVRWKRLELLDCFQLSTQMLVDSLQYCSGLTHLSVAGSMIDPEPIVSILPSLEILDVTKCPWRDDWRIAPNKNNERLTVYGGPSQWEEADW
eukprot:Nitzschia sp. Nitz4//scaffold15_size197535//135080//136216//NITZ4_001594-RA/size197535-processed-gene-0.87-mRNA-1//-1//CDS//3329537763//4050//frame0